MKKLLLFLSLLIILSTRAIAQTQPLPDGRIQFSNSGGVLVGGFVHTCVAGSTCPGTPLATFTDSTGNTQNANPVVLDGAGSASIWLSPSTSYKIVVTDAGSVVQWTEDGISVNPSVTSLTYALKRLNSIRFADQFAGADWGAKVNAADADLGAVAGEIWVNQNAGLTAPAANIVLSANHILRFVQGGNWSLGAKQILLNHNSGVESDYGYRGQGNNTDNNAVTLNYTGTGFAIGPQTNTAATNNAFVKGITILGVGTSCNQGINMQNAFSWLIEDVVVKHCKTGANAAGIMVYGTAATAYFNQINRYYSEDNAYALLFDADVSGDAPNRTMVTNLVTYVSTLGDVLITANGGEQHFRNFEFNGLAANKTSISVASQGSVFLDGGGDTSGGTNTFINNTGDSNSFENVTAGSGYTVVYTGVGGRPNLWGYGSPIILSSGLNDSGGQSIQINPGGPSTLTTTSGDFRFYKTLYIDSVNRVNAFDANANQQPAIYASSGTAGTYPFNRFSNLILQPPGAAGSPLSDIVFATGVAPGGPLVRFDIESAGGVSLWNSVGTFKTTLTSSATANGTWALPAVTSDTFVGLNAAQTISNKILGGSLIFGLLPISSSGGTTNANLSIEPIFQTALTENTTLAVTNIAAGKNPIFVIVQNATAAKTWTWPATFHGGMTISATLSSINTQQFVCTSNVTDCYALNAGSTAMTGGTP